MANKNTHTHQTLGPCTLLTSDDKTGESIVKLDSGEERTVSTIWLAPLDYNEPAKPDVAKRNKA